MQYTGPVFTSPPCTPPLIPAALTMTVVGPAPGGPFFHASTVAEPYDLIIGWNGSAWQFQFSYAGAWVMFVGTGVYVPGTRTVDYAATIFGPGAGCSGPALLSWSPTAWCAEQIIRASPTSGLGDYYDERLSPGGEVLHFDQPSIPLSGAVAWQVTGSGLVWAPDHVRGLTFKAGSQVGPRAAGQSISWEF